MRDPGSGPVTLGLGANWQQFTLLVVINGFVGALVGLERTVLPLLAEEEFGVVAGTATLSFLISFGLVKAAANAAAGGLADRMGRRRVLIAGWLIGLPVPLLLIFAPSWSWVVGANALLGANQGLCWSATVIMKVDLVGPRRRGLAMGLNEFAGYLAVSAAALLTGWLAARHGLRPAPFLPGIAFALAGLVLSAGWARDTAAHVRREAAERPAEGGPAPTFRQVLRLASGGDRSLFAASQAGFANNLNDAAAWALIPILAAGAGLPLDRVGLIAAVYPAVWGIGQLGAGALSDRWGRRRLIVGGMWLQALALAGFAATRGLGPWLGCAALLGAGTALVYPTLLAAVGDVAAPEWRGSAIGAYRLWRDAGYAAGGLGIGALVDAAGAGAAMGAAALLTALSGTFVAAAMEETLPLSSGSRS